VRGGERGSIRKEKGKRKKKKKEKGPQGQRAPGGVMYDDFRGVVRRRSVASVDLDWEGAA